MNLLLDSRDHKFVLQELLDTEDVCRMPVWSDFSPDMFDMVLNEAQRLVVESGALQGTEGHSIHDGPAVECRG
jgi:hypothetical protein